MHRNYKEKVLTTTNKVKAVGEKKNQVKTENEEEIVELVQNVTWINLLLNKFLKT